MQTRSIFSAFFLVLSLGATGCDSDDGDGTSSGGTAAEAGGDATAGADGAEGADGADGGGDGGGGAGTCQQTCETAADCCPDGVEGCPGDYPLNYTCDDGFCGFPQCTSDDQCTFGGVVPNGKCVSVAGFNVCITTCADDSECTAPTTCSGEVDGERYCSGESSGGCQSDAECGGQGTCSNGACTCAADSECTVDGFACRQ